MLLGLPVEQATDQRPAQHAIDQLKQRGLLVRHASKWLGAVSVEATLVELKAISQLPGVTGVAPFEGHFYPASIGPVNKAKKQDSTYSMALQQMKFPALQKAGLNGQGIKVGLIDGGFRDADKHQELKHLFQRDKVKAARDFVLPSHTPRFYRGRSDSLDSHGTTVLKMVAGYDPEEQNWLGAATEAEFWLARTDNAQKEYRAEEDQWLAAMEWMDSVGVRLINSSLGYGKGFDNPAENYKPTQMTGNQTVISKAARMAVKDKGIIVILSAGNEGNDPQWRYISSPADVQQVIAVGATTGFPYPKAGYSGIGPEYNKYVKPDVSVYSLTGTSFAAPALTGVVACLLQQNPALKPAQMQELLWRSSSLYPYANNYLGYGVPDMSLALEAAKTSDGWKTGPKVKSSVINIKAERERFINFCNELGSTQNIVMFLKRNKTEVVRMVVIGEKFTADEMLKELRKAEDAKYATFMQAGQVLEIEY